MIHGVKSLKTILKQMIFSLVLGTIVPSLMFEAASVVVSKRSAGERDPQPFGVSQLQIPVLQQNGDIENMKLDDYLTNVLLGEVSPEFHEEALKAQAVAARTYTLRCIETGKHDIGAVCTDYHCCQAYREPEEYLDRGGTEAGLLKFRQAVQETSAQVLYYEDSLINATYFASSGGMTEDAREVWGQEYPYLKPVSSPGEEDCGYFSYQESISPEQLQSLLGVELIGKPPSWFGIVTYTAGGGVDLMRIGGKLYTGVELRKCLGLRSTVFEVIPTDEVILIKTKGYGHRVGLSQHGADAMAAAGKSYQEILSHYYQGAVLAGYPSESH